MDSIPYFFGCFSVYFFETRGRWIRRYLDKNTELFSKNGGYGHRLANTFRFMFSWKLNKNCSKWVVLVMALIPINGDWDILNLISLVPQNKTKKKQRAVLFLPAPNQSHFWRRNTWSEHTHTHSHKQTKEWKTIGENTKKWYYNDINS